MTLAPRTVRTTLAVAGAILVASCSIPESRSRSDDAASAFVLHESLPPVVVAAQRPSLTEILDIILRERPTAEQLAGTARSGVFPEGSDEAHIAAILSRYSRDRERVSRIAAALVKESRRRKIGSSLLVGVLLTENPWLDPRATSFAGARGLMQVMPFHAGKWGCGTSDLFDIESNICHGVAVLADNLGRSKTLPQALLGYNGCVRGINTPDCWRYPSKVYREARKGAPAEGGLQPFSTAASRGKSRSAGSS